MRPIGRLDFRFCVFRAVTSVNTKNGSACGILGIESLLLLQLSLGCWIGLTSSDTGASGTQTPHLGHRVLISLKHALKVSVSRHRPAWAETASQSTEAATPNSRYPDSACLSRVEALTVDTVYNRPVAPVPGPAVPARPRLLYVTARARLDARRGLL